jgi:hypothetical protein
MSGAAGLCSQNHLDDSIPFMAPEPYVITRAVIDQLTAIVDRDIRIESEALQLYTITEEQRTKINTGIQDLIKQRNAGGSSMPINLPTVKEVYNTSSKYGRFHSQMKKLGVATFTKKENNAFTNKATEFNKKERYTTENTSKLILDPLEISALSSYTRRGDVILNNLLRYGNSDEPLSEVRITSIIREECYGKNYGLLTRDYNRVCFIFFKILYNTIVKIKDLYHKNNKYIKVFRGVKKQYLSENPGVAYYTNSFLSTSFGIDVAEEFGYIPEYIPYGLAMLGKYDINVFYVHPSCYYCNMEGITQFSNEREILITPYCRYVFIAKNTFCVSKKGKRNDAYRTCLYTKYYYAVFPTDLTIPAKFEDFISFRSSLPAAAGAIQEGATDEVVQVNIPVASGGGYTRRRRSKRRTTRRRIKA